MLIRLMRIAVDCTVSFVDVHVCTTETAHYTVVSLQ